jgi:hypothetical protein
VPANKSKTSLSKTIEAIILKIDPLTLSEVGLVKLLFNVLSLWPLASPDITLKITIPPFSLP